MLGNVFLVFDKLVKSNKNTVTFVINNINSIFAENYSNNIFTIILECLF